MPLRIHPDDDGGPSDIRLGQIVRLLTDHAMVVVSGTKIADEIGTSRSEVWRLVQQLRGLGVAIAGHPATGYQLESVPDLLLPDYVAPLVRGTIFAPRIHHYFKTDSTNVAAMQAAQAGEAEGAVFLAEEQLAGRGRGGHSWHSARSTGIYCSVILRPELAPADVVVVSLMTGLAVQSAVEEVTGSKPDLRWPNDLLLSRPPLPDDPSAFRSSRKFCGILAEMNAEATRIRYLVVGIGLNVNQAEFPADLRDLATSLRIETGHMWSRVELTGALLRALDREYKKVRAGDPLARRDVMRRFEQNSTYARGLRVHVDEDGGYDGVTDGLDERGFLRVRTEYGVRTVLSGGVRAI